MDANYWTIPSNRRTVLCNLLSLAIFATAKNSDAGLPLESWRIDLQTAGIFGPDMDRFFGLLTGRAQIVDTELIDQAAAALYKIRTNAPSSLELFGCHFRLLNLLVSGDWGLFAGETFSEMVSSHWLNVAQNQRFALRSPSTYGPLIQEKCRESGLSGYTKAASILEIAAIASGTNVAGSGKEFLTRVKAGEFPVRK